MIESNNGDSEVRFEDQQDVNYDTQKKLSLPPTSSDSHQSDHSRQILQFDRDFWDPESLTEELQQATEEDFSMIEPYIDPSALYGNAKVQVKKQPYYNPSKCVLTILTLAFTRYIKKDLDEQLPHMTKLLDQCMSNFYKKEKVQTKKSQYINYLKRLENISFKRFRDICQCQSATQFGKMNRILINNFLRKCGYCHIFNSRIPQKSIIKYLFYRKNILKVLQNPTEFQSFWKLQKSQT